jgi:hypothetical protein
MKPRVNWSLVGLFTVALLALPVGHFLGATDRAHADPPPIRKVTASQCPAATLVVIEQATVGVVVERADALPDSLDQTPTVRVLVLKPQTDPPSAYKVGDVAQLGGVEIVISRGPLVVPD